MHKLDGEAVNRQRLERRGGLTWPKATWCKWTAFVKEVMVGGNFRVEVEGGHNVLAQLAGNMRRNRIRVVLGDQVTVAVSPYDPTRGLIVFRAK